MKECKGCVFWDRKTIVEYEQKRFPDLRPGVVFGDMGRCAMCAFPDKPFASAIMLNSKGTSADMLTTSDFSCVRWLSKEKGKGDGS